MTPGKFLRLVWPDQGFYCIAHPFKLPDGGTTYYHKIFDTISAAVTHVHEMVHMADVFFAVLSLREAEVIDMTQLDYKTQLPGKKQTRVARNMLAAKSLFFDLDVGAETAKYPTQQDALAALVAFVATTNLPMPTLVSSGGGVHVYWHFDTTILVDEWSTIAWHLRQLAEGLGLKVDPTRTTDTTSVLRVPDTFNRKNPDAPRPVKVLQEGVVTPVAALRQVIADAMVRAGIIATAAPAPRASPSIAGADGLVSNIEFEDFGPKMTLSEVAAACGQVQQMVLCHGDPQHPHYGQLDNTAWYRGFLATVKHVEDGERWCHKLTDMHPRSVSDTEVKLRQLDTFGPAKCETLAQFMPWKDAPCQTCRFRNDPSVPNPLVAARKSTGAPPPVVEQPTPSAGPAVVQLMAPGLNVQQAMIPNPPKPYERLKVGGISLTRKDKDGDDQVSIIYPHDLFPLKRLVNAGAATEQQLWRVVLPRTGSRDFIIDADALYDTRKFCAALANNGIYPNKADISALQDYMTAYIAQLQKDLDGEEQSDHLGWADEYRSFILPDKILRADGSVRTSALSKGALTATQHIHKGGDLNAQVQLMQFFNNPAYVAHQYAIINSLASILLHATGQHGIVVNMSGDAGASKSTTLYTGASLWANPALWPLNGTEGGATPKARMQRISTNANLPTFVDEITHIPTKDITDIVMNVTQPGHRVRLMTDGSERQASGGYKSAIMITTANNSLHSALSADSTAGTAGSMRVFEMRFVAMNIHTKPEADEYLRQIKIHFGHIGEVFAHFVIRNLAAVNARVQQVMREVDIEARIASAERFWGADIAVVYVAAEIAQALQLLPYAPALVRRWAIDHQVPYMRGVVKEEHRDSLSVLTDYIAEKNGSIIVITQSTSIGVNTTTGQHVAGDTAYAANNPHGALLGHYDIKIGVLYLLKHGFKDYCQRIGASSTRIIEELGQARPINATESRRIIVNRNTRRTLGAGTTHAKGQAWCIAVDMNHPEMSGATPLTAVTGGQPVSAPAGNLKSVP